MNRDVRVRPARPKFRVGCDQLTHSGLMASAALAIVLLSRPAAAAAQTAVPEPTSAEPSPSVSPELSAQSTTAMNGQENATEPAGEGFGDIIVTAQRREQRLQDVPLTIVAVSGDTLAKAGVTTVRDLQNIVPGFTFAGQAASTQPAIRGVSTTVAVVGSENPNALYVDDVYQGTLGVLSNELPDVERIEVLKGPQGTLFGRNATGGAVRIFTRQPSFDPNVNFVVEGSYYPGADSSTSSPRVNVRGFVTGPIVDGLLAASVSAGYNWTEGFNVDEVTGRRAGIRRNENLRGKLLFTPGEKLKITAGAYYINNNNEQGASTTPYKGLTAAAGRPDAIIPRDPWHSAYFGDFPGAFLKQHGFTMRGELETSPGTFTVITGYNKTKVNNFNVTYAAKSISCLAASVCVNVKALSDNREFSQELNFASRQFGIVSFVSGLYYYNQKGNANAFIQEPIVPGGVRIQGLTTRTKAYAAYGEATVQPTDALSVIVGLRYGIEKKDDNGFAPVIVVKKDTFRSTTPRIAIKYVATDDLNLYATYSIGFKGGLTGVTNTGGGFTPVDPEKLYAYEVGAKYATRGLSINVSGFYYDYKNKQENSFSGIVSQTSNTGPVRLYGVDVDANARLTDALSIRAGASWLAKAEYRDFPNASGRSLVRGATGAFLAGRGNVAGTTFDATGLRLARAPKLTASAMLNYEQEWASGTFDASATLYYSSKVFHDITQTIVQPSYATLNAQAGYLIGDSGVRVGVFGRNLTNKAYIVSGLTGASGFVVGHAPPLEVGLSLGYSF